MENNKTFEAGTREQDQREKEITTAAQEQEEENKYLIKFRKPFLFEDETYTEIDLSGLEDLSARDMIRRSARWSGPAALTYYRRCPWNTLVFSQARPPRCRSSSSRRCRRRKRSR